MAETSGWGPCTEREVADLCAAGVDAEVENAALYDRLLVGTERSDVLAVYRNLREASQERHLPAFRRCVEGGGRGGGRGARRGGGRDGGPGRPRRAGRGWQG